MIRQKNPKKFRHASFVLLLFILFSATPVVSALVQKMNVERLDEGGLM